SANHRTAPVRLAVVTGPLAPRSTLWRELVCCNEFAMPYLWVALPYAHDFFMNSLRQGESSDAPTGLPYRWIIKFFLYLAFLTVSAAVAAVAARCVVALFGTPEQRERAHVPFARQG
ncbi:MAG: hypothetical protein ACK52R_02270, partial [Betaproteobacteria bacterium]